MRAEEIIALAVRLFAIVLILYAMREGIASIAYASSYDNELYPYLYTGLMLITIAFSVLLWRFPMTIAHNLMSFRHKEVSSEAPVTASQLQIIGLTLLGIYLFAQLLSTLVGWFIVWFIAQRSHTPLNLDNGDIGSLIGTFLELVFALFLIFGARRLDALLRKR